MTEGLGADESLNLVTQPAKSGDVVCSALAPGQNAVCQPGLTDMC